MARSNLLDIDQIPDRVSSNRREITIYSALRDKLETFPVGVVTAESISWAFRLCEDSIIVYNDALGVRFIPDSCGNLESLLPDVIYMVDGEGVNMSPAVTGCDAKQSFILSAKQFETVTEYINHALEARQYLLSLRNPKKYTKWLRHDLNKDQKRVIRSRVTRRDEKPGANGWKRGPFDIIRGVLVRKMLNAYGMVKYLRVFLSVDEFLSVTRDAHFDEHSGPRHCVDNLQHNYYLYTLAGIVEDLCTQCQLCNVDKAKARHAELRPILTNFPRQMYVIDYSKWMDWWVLHMIDHFSKYEWVEIYETKEAANVESFLEEVFQQYGVPFVYLADNGKEFVAGNIKDFLNRHTVEERHGLPYHPETQGVIERAHRTIKARVNKLWMQSELRGDSEFENLDQHDPEVMLQKSYRKMQTCRKLFKKAVATKNHQKHKTTGCIPSEVLTGYVDHTFFSKVNRDFLDKETEPIPDDKYQALIDRARNNMRKDAEYKMKKSSSSLKQQIIGLDEIHVGSVVLVRYDVGRRVRQPGEMTYWHALAKIHERLDPFSYKIKWVTKGKLSEDQPGTVAARVYNIDSLKRVNPNVPPEQLIRILKLNHEYRAVIENSWEWTKILAKREVANGLGRLEYLVFWKGYRATMSTWEPRTHIRGADNALLSRLEDWSDLAASDIIRRLQTIDRSS